MSHLPTVPRAKGQQAWPESGSLEVRGHRRAAGREPGRLHGGPADAAAAEPESQARGRNKRHAPTAVLPTWASRKTGRGTLLSLRVTQNKPEAGSAGQRLGRDQCAGPSTWSWQLRSSAQGQQQDHRAHPGGHRQGRCDLVYF